MVGTRECRKMLYLLKAGSAVDMSVTVFEKTRDFFLLYYDLHISQLNYLEVSDSHTRAAIKPMIIFIVIHYHFHSIMVQVL